MTDASNFIKIVVLGRGAPFTGTLCAVTLQQETSVSTTALILQYEVSALSWLGSGTR